MTKGKLLGCLRKLNKHYKRHVFFRTGYPLSKENTPCADLYLQTLFFPPEPIFYDKYILAHEYAHILDNDVDSGHAPKKPETAHDNEFELVYQEVCLVLGVFAISPKELAARVLKLAVDSGYQILNNGFPKHCKWELKDSNWELVGIDAPEKVPLQQMRLPI